MTVGLLSLQFGCGHLSSQVASNDSVVEDVTVTEDDGKWLSAPTVYQLDTDEVLGIKLTQTTFDIPVLLNTKVEQWIDYFTGRGRDYFEVYLRRSEHFIPFMLPILKENKAPADLVYLAMIESGFNNHARSRAKAVGPWQFIAATGKRYGLKVNYWVDERRDVRKSTLSALRYMKDLYRGFGSWELAAAAYNAGEAKIARGIRRFGVRDYWVLAQSRFLRPETRNYVPKLMAAAIVAKNRVQFGFPEKFLDAEPVIDDPSLDLKKDEALPAVISSTTDIGSDVEEVEENIEGAAQGDLADAVDPIDEADIPMPHVDRKSGNVSRERIAEVDLQSPADLLKVARAAGIAYQTIKSLNPEILRWCTPPNVRTFKVKLPETAKDRFLTTYNHPAYPREIDFKVYYARPGDTLSLVARRFGLRDESVADLNSVNRLGALRQGERILLPMPNDRTRSIASLDLFDPPTRSRARHRTRYKSSRHGARSGTLTVDSR